MRTRANLRAQLETVLGCPLSETDVSLECGDVRRKMGDSILRFSEEYWEWAVTTECELTRAAAPDFDGMYHHALQAMALWDVWGETRAQKIGTWLPLGVVTEKADAVAGRLTQQGARVLYNGGIYYLHPGDLSLAQRVLKEILEERAHAA